MDWPYLSVSNEMKTRMENGFSLCYNLFGSDLLNQTIKLFYQKNVWLTIGHSSSYNSESRKLKRMVTLTLDNETMAIQEVALNYSNNWDKFCFKYNKTSNEKTFLTNGLPTTKINDTLKKMYSTDLVIFKVVGMFSLVTISSISSALDKAKQEGDIHNWNTSQWIFDKNYRQNISSLYVYNPLIMFVPLKQDLDRAYGTCMKLGNGVITEFKNQTSWKETYSFYKKMYPDLDFIHVPFEEKANNPVHSFYHSRNVNDTFWLNSCPNNFTSKYYAYNGTNCYSYSMYVKEKYYFFCNFSFPQVFKLNGLPYDSQGLFYPNFRLQKMIWLGFNGTFIQFESDQWIGKISNSSIYIKINATKYSLLTGRNEWKIYNVSSLNNDVLSLNLSLHSCKSEEFVCDDGSCISYEQRCDGTYDCTDFSDEAGCNFIRHSDGYNKDMIVNKWGKSKVNLTLNLHLIEVHNININDGKLSLKLNITAKWFDERLKYVYLNSDTRLNVLGSDEFNSIWNPKLIYSNKDTYPHFENVAPVISVGLENQLFEPHSDKTTGATTKQFHGELNPLYWSSVIR